MAGVSARLEVVVVAAVAELAAVVKEDAAAAVALEVAAARAAQEVATRLRATQQSPACSFSACASLCLKSRRQRERAAMGL